MRYAKVMWDFGRIPIILIAIGMRRNNNVFSVWKYSTRESQRFCNLNAYGISLIKGELPNYL